MPTYVTLAGFTQQGIERIEDSPALLTDAQEEADARDGELHDVFVTFGEYDLVMISEFPDDESCAQFALSVAQRGGLETETLKAFTEDEYADVVAGLHGPVGGPHGEQ